MKTADLYIRTATPLSSSMVEQEQLLRDYCNKYRISIHSIIKEVASEKNFERKEWEKYLSSPNKGDLLLFVSWDRFSRNVGEVFIMIRKLTLLGVTPRAIESSTPTKEFANLNL